MIKNKNGFVLPYTIFIFMLVLNIFIFVVLCNLNTVKTFDNKINYYHVFILEERAKRHITEKIDANNVTNFETELIYYDQDFIYFIYQFDSVNRIWCCNLRIKYHNINEFATVYYNLNTHQLDFVSL